MFEEITRFFPGCAHLSGRLAALTLDLCARSLVAMEEPSLALPSDARETYRFLWLPSFRDEACVRIALDRSGATVTTKVRKRAHPDYEPQIVRWRHERHVAADAMTLMASSIDASFWSAPVAIERMGLDGAEWMLDGRRGSRHHVVCRWSPDEWGPDAAFRAACEEILLLGTFPDGWACRLF